MTLTLILFPALLVIAAMAAYLRARVAREAVLDGGAPPRPFWTSPAGFAVVSVIVLAVGAFVAPRLLGITFLLLPFLWSRGPGRGAGGRGPWRG
ncbi:MAG: hypothetical protein ACKOKE_01015 [Actinomycetota bacterium]